MNTFTVICLYPEYATENFVTDTLIRTFEARNAVSVHSQTSYRGAPPVATLITIEQPVGGSSNGAGGATDAAAWWAVVQRQLESGLSQMAFCAAERPSVSSLQN